MKLQKLLAVTVILILIGSIALHIQDKKSENTEKPPVFLIVLESTRADHIGPCYSYNRVTAPNICQLAEDGVLYEKAYSAGSHTPMALPSFVTGMPPNSVGFKNWSEFAFNAQLSKNASTIAEAANKAGYKTYTNIGLSPFLWKDGVGQGFDKKNVSDINRSFRKTEFYWIRLFRAHTPYTPEEQFRKWDELDLNKTELDRYDHQRKPLNLTDQQLINLYDEEILSADSTVGKFLKNLKDQGLYKESMIIVTSDHGESFGEHGNYYHGNTPYSEETHVPLVIKYPENRYAGKTVDRQVSLMDIPETLFQRMNFQTKTYADNLLPGSENKYPAISARKPDSGWAIRLNESSLILENVEGFCKFDEDPIILQNKSADNRTLTELCDFYKKGERNELPPEKRNMSVELENKLKDLGYLE